jgi:beta-N-acetylhexosaminidase
MIGTLVQLFWLLPLLAGQPADPAHARAEEILSGMSLEQKVGQLMMVGFGGRTMGPEISRLLLDHHIGSVALYSRNISNTKQLAKLVRDIRKTMQQEIQPFVAIDQEGGNVVRVRTDVTVLPGAMALGATRDPVLAYLAGQANAVDLGLLGIDMNLAPVLDVNRNPANPVINIRAFGDHPKLVAKIGVWFILGQQQAGMATVAKHFPGHGDTSHDSHFSLPVTNESLEQLRGIALLPFREAVDAGLDAIMTAHVRVPAVDDSDTPASLSKKVISDLLRGEMAYDGLVITDDLEMRAIAERMTVGEAAVKAILAGADVIMVIWTPRKKHQVFESLIAAVKDGRISQSRIDESVRRILRLKAKRGTLDALSGKMPSLADSFPNPYHSRLVRTIAHRGVTLVRNQGSVLPLCQSRGVLVAGPQKVFLNEMKKLLPKATIVQLSRVPTRKRRQEDLNKLTKLAGQHRVVVVAVVNAYQAWLVQRLSHKIKVPLVAVSFGSPYYLRNFPKVTGYLCAYSYLASAQKAAARALCSRISITGRLPVTITKHYRRGHGVTLPRGTCSTAASR